MSTSDSGLADCDDRRWKVLLKWLKGHGMMVDGDHLLVRPKHVEGTNYPSPMCPESSRPDKTIRHYQAQDSVCSRSLTSPFVLECLSGVPDSPSS